MCWLCGTYHMKGTKTLHNVVFAVWNSKNSTHTNAKNRKWFQYYYYYCVFTLSLGSSFHFIWVLLLFFLFFALLCSFTQYVIYCIDTLNIKTLHYTHARKKNIKYIEMKLMLACMHCCCCGCGWVRCFVSPIDVQSVSMVMPPSSPCSVVFIIMAIHMCVYCDTHIFKFNTHHVRCECMCNCVY